MTELYPPINTWEDFYLHLDDCIARDDKEKFVRICKEHRAEGSGFLSKDVLLSRALKCIEAYLTGESFWDGSPPFVDNYHFGVFLHLSADPHVAKLLVEKSNVKDHLNCSCDTTAPVAKWSNGDSLIKLTILICHPELKPELETLRILARHTDKLNELACNLVKEWGEVKQLAALLLVAQGKVMAPLRTGMTIKDYFANQADQDKCADHYAEAIKLLELFERVGGFLSRFYALLPKTATVKKATNGVVGIYEKLGFTLMEKDLDFSHYFGPRARVAKKYRPPQESSTNPFSYSNMKMRGKSRKQGAGSLQASASFQTSRAFSTSQMGGSIKKDGNLTRLVRQPVPSLNFLAYVALNLKKGIKFL